MSQLGCLTRTCLSDNDSNLVLSQEFSQLIPYLIHWQHLSLLFQGLVLTELCRSYFLATQQSGKLGSIFVVDLSVVIDLHIVLLLPLSFLLGKQVFEAFIVCLVLLFSLLPFVPFPVVFDDG